MKAVIKILTALAAIAGIVYVIATYGDQIVAWAKKVLNSLPKCPCCEKEEPAAEEVAAEEAPAEEAPVEEAAEEVVIEVPTEEVAIEENEPVAEEADFEA